MMSHLREEVLGDFYLKERQFPVPVFRSYLVDLWSLAHVPADLCYSACKRKEMKIYSL